MKRPCALILAAGKGVRMKSDRPKVMHEILGLPMVFYPVNICMEIGADVIAVVGHGKEYTMPYLKELGAECVVQDPPMGTGDAVRVARDMLVEKGSEDILIIPGDMPLVRKESIEALVSAYRESSADMAVLTSIMDNPYGYGRIIRNDEGHVTEIVEESDADTRQRQVREVNTGVYIARKDFLLNSVPMLHPENAKGEFYLTDIVKMADIVASSMVIDGEEANGINSRVQLAHANEVLRSRINISLMEEGVTLYDPLTTWVSPIARISRDAEIWPGVHILGRSKIGGNVKIMPNTWIRDSYIGDGSVVGNNSVIENSSIEQDSRIAPNSNIIGPTGPTE